MNQQPVQIGGKEQQGRAWQAVAKIAVSDQQQPATEKEKVLAMWRYRDFKKQF